MGASRAPCAPHVDELSGEHRIRKQLEAVPNDSPTGTRKLIKPQPFRQSAPLPCHNSTDALLRIGRNTAETNTAAYQ